MSTHLRDLRRANLRELESLYLSAPVQRLPSGLFRGVYLTSIPQPSLALRLMRPAMVGGFWLPPFGVDFDRNCWFFWHRVLRVGRFQPDIGTSRWRETQVVRLHYHVSSLPHPVRRWLYDEVKPLSDDLCLGIGGINAPKGYGEQFYFALHKAA